MDRTTFSQLNFTEKNRKEIRNKINQQNEREENILLALMQLLVTQKTGFELAQLLRARDIRKFEDSQGGLYTLLHRLEQSMYIRSSWDVTSVAKYYQLTDKGGKVLKKLEKKQTNTRLAFKELLEG